MPTRRAYVFLTVMCIALSIFVTLATYCITYTDPRAPIGGPTAIYHGAPLHWIVEIWPMPRPMPGPVGPTVDSEPINFLLDTLFYTALFTATALLILREAT